MKKTIKRIFAWMIVLTLVFSVFPAAAFAEESTEEIGHQHEEVVEEIPGEGTEPSQEPAQEEELPAAEEEELPAEPAEEEPSVEEEPEEPVEEPAPEVDLTEEEANPAEEETLPQEEETAEPEEEVSLMATDEMCPKCGSPLMENDGRAPTYTGNGWQPYLSCTNEDCTYSTYVEIPALGTPSIKSYDDFLTNLELLEMVAQEYVKPTPARIPSHW